MSDLLSSPASDKKPCLIENIKVDGYEILKLYYTMNFLGCIAMLSCVWFRTSIHPISPNHHIVSIGWLGLCLVSPDSVINSFTHVNVRPTLTPGPREAASDGKSLVLSSKRSDNDNRETNDGHYRMGNMVESEALEKETSLSPGEINQNDRPWIQKDEIELARLSRWIGVALERDHRWRYLGYEDRMQ